MVYGIVSVQANLVLEFLMQQEVLVCVRVHEIVTGNFSVGETGQS